ncbi:PLP-dependent transferase [Mollisia scopiformis]|uniref:PLP-dependent transferase n=1 Tax=Mollisia scopiformis TaxID=149040 RepID=A0A194X2C0_MOLSC|nr:PLP-dependent transferase [Mollisia scopiformis]KUJ13977.1 PLP-dependent transferase [Mollisia scopiformis]
MVAEIETPAFGPIPPFAHHAITFHLPKWALALRFMEKDMTILQQLKAVYPRIMLHQDVKALIAKIVEKSETENQTCLPFPSQAAADECVAFATSEARGENRCKPEEISIRLFATKTIYLWTVFFPAPKAPAVIPFWQNSGTGISTRVAEQCMKEISDLKEISLWSGSPTTSIKQGPAHEILRDRISSLMNRAPAGPPRETQVSPEDVYLFQTGMSSIYTVHRYLTKKFNSRSVLFGFAFHSTPHVFEDFGPGSKFFGNGDAADLDALEAYLQDEAKEGRKIQALWTEFPSNPLLSVPDLGRLRELADQYEFFLIVDDTIASFCNVDLLGVADMVASSLTKSFSGYADVMGASAVLSPTAKRYEELKKLMADNYQNVVYEGDAEVLEKNSRNYIERSKVLNNNAKKLVEYLGNLAKDPKSSVAKVYYPNTSENLDAYKKYMRQPTQDFEPGYGCLFSVEMDTVEATSAFYDNLHVHQGPHLGAHLTLTIPYVKALYGKELDKVGEYGLNEKQLRVSVGLEDTEALIDVFRHALTFADGVKTKKEPEMLAMT